MPTGDMRRFFEKTAIRAALIPRRIRGAIRRPLPADSEFERAILRGNNHFVLRLDEPRPEIRQVRINGKADPALPRIREHFKASLRLARAFFPLSELEEFPVTLGYLRDNPRFSMVYLSKRVGFAEREKTAGYSLFYSHPRGMTWMSTVIDPKFRGGLIKQLSESGKRFLHSRGQQAIVAEIENPLEAKGPVDRLIREKRLRYWVEKNGARILNLPSYGIPSWDRPGERQNYLLVAVPTHDRAVVSREALSQFVHDLWRDVNRVPEEQIPVLKADLDKEIRAIPHANVLEHSLPLEQFIRRTRGRK